MLYKFMLGVDFLGECYQFASVNFSPKKQEMFYHFSSTFAGKKPIMRDAGNDGDLQIGIPDHISFHQDGRVHIKYKKSSHRKVIEKFDDNVFNLIRRGKVYPILLDCIYNLDKGSLPVTQRDIPAQKLWSMQKKKFCALLFLIHKKTNPRTFLQKYHLNSKYGMSGEKIMLEAFNDFLLMITVCNVSIKGKVIPNATLMRAYNLFPEV